MNGPGRLRDEDLSPLERALLEEGASYRSSPSARAKTLASLGLAAGGAAVAGGAAAASLGAGATAGATAKVAAQLTWVKVVAALSTLGAVAAVPAGYYGWQRFHQPEAGVAAETERARRERPAPAAPEPPAGLLPAEPELEAAFAAPDGAGAPAAVAVAAPLERPRARARTAGRATGDARGSARLRLELAALDAARGALAAGDAGDALDLLDRYARSYPRGLLALEADVLRIDAWATSGRRDIARRRAEAFLRRHPGSVLAPRVRSYLTD